ncbi:hypothetical protein M975_0081 [Buttiauxella brennerae ATCC 51605]|uniref:Uncharacterized protein n=1 Tax=Buttiauxella brennerae ATCC 51605 TaxID=1354251 RepID=A0A1B7IX18_9ENTR|nr:hypothetical protein [Buttiauxella brennerae]OAT34552.1 hypothetical protein M975_0081 [Buttiauxella brennerae ATCC 51605]
MNNKVKKTSQKIECVIHEIDNVIINNDPAILSISSTQQLTAFKMAFLGVLEKIKRDAIPPKNERNLGISNVIIDQWPFSLTLGRLIIEAENLYREM